MKLKFLLMSCSFCFTVHSFCNPVNEREKLIRKLPRDQRKLVQQIDKATVLPEISEIHLKTEHLWQIKKDYARYVKSKK